MKKQIYTIQVLSDKAFENLHKSFPEVDEKTLKTALGFANKETGEAYVRKTSVAEIDATTMQHELHELIAKNSEHEDENNIRWKKAKDVLKNVVAPAALSLIPGVGPLLAGAYSGGRTYKKTGDIGRSLLSGGLSFAGGKLGQSGTGYKSAVAASKAAGGGILGQTLSGGQGMLQGALGALPGFGKGGVLSGVTKAFTPGAIKSGILGTTGQLAPGMITSGIVSQATPNLTRAGLSEAARMGLGTTSKIAGGLSEKLTSARAVSTPGAGGINAPKTPSTPSLIGSVPPTGPTGPLTGALPPGLPGTPAPGAPPSIPGVSGVGEVAKKVPTFGEKAGEFLTPQNVLGAGTLLGSAAIPSPEFQMPSSIEDIRQKILAQTEGGPGGLTQLGQQAQAELGNILSSPASELYPTAGDAYYDAALRRTRDNYERAQEELDKVYNSAGVFGTGEHLAQKAKLREELARTESSLTAEVEQRRFELARTAKYTAIQDSLGVDKNVMDDLIGLSGLDVELAAQMYGAQVKDVISIREALGTLGAELLVRGQKGAVKSEPSAEIE